MAQALGNAFITDTGKGLLAYALAGGELVLPKYYKFSSDYYTARADMTSADIPVAWKTQDIDLYQMIDANTVEFVMTTEALDADFQVATISIYLEDGTLFAVANPSHPIAGGQKQIAKVQLSYAEIGQLVNFQYVPYSKTDSDLALLDTIVTHGNQITKNQLDIEAIIIQGII